MRKLLSTGWVLLSICVPFFLIMSSVRVWFTPYLFLDVAYHLPGFPEDTYGFSQADRLNWSKISLDYLFNDQPLTWLADQSLPDGKPLYTDRELGHMLDVKNLLQAMYLAWWILLALLVTVGLLAWRTKALRNYWRALAAGGWLTILLIIAILVFVGVSFIWLFTEFHRLFFTGDTWLFLFSDTLIRLFPIFFWQAGFVAVSGLTAIFALLVGIFGRRFSR